MFQPSIAVNRPCDRYCATNLPSTGFPSGSSGAVYAARTQDQSAQWHRGKAWGFAS